MKKMILCCLVAVLGCGVFAKGIKDIQVDVPSKEVTVTYDSAKTSPEELIKGFGKIRVKAEEKPVK